MCNYKGLLCNIYIMALIDNIITNGIIKFGSFTLKSGKQSNMYVDFRKVISNPDLLVQISYELTKLLDIDITDNKNLKNFVVCGVPMGGIPYGVMVSTITRIPMIMVRKEAKSHGTCNLIEGDYLNKQCILIEDVATTGSSVIEVAKQMESEGVIIKKIIIILNRGGMENIKNAGYNVSSLLSI